MKYEACSRHLITTFATIVDPNRQGSAIEIGVGTQEYYFVDFVKHGFPTLAVEPLPSDDLVLTSRRLNIPLEKAAISEEDGEVTLYLGEYEGEQNFNFNSLNADWWGVGTPETTTEIASECDRIPPSAASSLQVPSLKLNSLLQKWQIERISILKVDTEGSEFTIINGLKEIPTEALPSIIQFEYGGGGAKQSQQGSWNPKYFNSTLACLDVLKSLGYQWLLLIDWHLPVVREFWIPDLENFADIFHPISHVGNAIVCKDGQLKHQVNLTDLCQPYVDYYPELAASLVNFGSDNLVHSFKWILPYVIVQQYQMKRRPLRVLEYGPGCNSQQFISSLVCKQLVSIEDNLDWYHKFAPVLASASEVEVDYQLIEVKSEEGKAYSGGHCWTEEEILAYSHYPLKYGARYFDIIFVDAGDRQDDVTINDRTYHGWPIRNLCLELAHSLLNENGIVVLHDIPGPFPQMNSALAENITTFNYSQAFPEFCTTLLSDSLDLMPLGTYIRKRYRLNLHPQTRLEHQKQEATIKWDNLPTQSRSPEANSEGLDVAKPVISMSTLGTNGRFANQLFQYGFLKIYAKQHNLRVETLDWIGQYLFGHNDPVISKKLPEVIDRSTTVHNSKILNAKEPLKNVEIWGYFQYHTSYYNPEKEYFRSLFKPVPAVERKMQPALDCLRSKGKTAIGIHLRLKDYGFSYFFIAPTIWYKKWLESIWETVEEPVLFIASDEPEKVLQDFSEYNPVTTKDLGIELPEAEFYPDFYLLSHCDVLAISNSSFSFAASMLNERGKLFVRPDWRSQKLVSYDPWNSEPLLRDVKIGKFESDRLRPLRQQMADRWLSLSPDRLEITYLSAVGTDLRLLLDMGLKDEPLTATEHKWVDRLNLQLASGLDTPAALQSLLILMLYRDAYQLPLNYAGAAIPNWFLHDFMEFLFSAPSNFQEPGETTKYYHYVQGLVNYIHTHLFKNTDSEIWRYIALCFTKYHNFSFLSLCEENLKHILSQRSHILEFTLKIHGHKLDYIFPERPLERTKIRLGVLQDNFFKAQETIVTLAAFEHLNKEKFEIILYALEVKGEPLEQYCQSRADLLVELPTSLQERVENIRGDDLDILLIGTDPTGSTNEIALLALHRLARIQSTGPWVPVTTGMRHTDYYIAGHFTIPTPTHEEHYREKVVTLQGSGLCFKPLPDLEAPQIKPNRTTWGATDESVIFMSATNFYKLIPELRETWIKIMAAVPNSILVLYPFGPKGAEGYPSSAFYKQMQGLFVARGLDKRRLVLIEKLSSRADLSACMQQADVYLDAYPYTGDLSLVDPLKVGLPTVVREGISVRSRTGAALMRELQLSELIADSEAAYVRIAVSLGIDAQQRQQYRERIQQQFGRTPQFLDTRAYSVQMGALLSQIFQERTKPESGSL